MIKPSLFVCTAFLVIACSETDVQHSADNSAVTEVKSESDVHTDRENWGDFHLYFNEDTHATNSVIVGVAKIKPGEQVHPAHRHKDEEYLLITKGEGIWLIHGEERPAKAGDMLYAAPWDYHGITAAADSPLEFVVFKYSAKDTPPPVDPDPSLPELDPRDPLTARN
ncbi:mannose-6-phosphate isomerase-like protein (cupin superfamily) [Litorimonas taeanensis]|uniref:Mannose-6-phosphate isomerase-like protein (Cupin superfamily) n=1 Tax=Litorimonas taeanensis TaxID=568099 RepID=A0A420WJ53_9PROT|nr:cupin domain-containing protein [Litorimonas taeanensis]RKQ71037.1 mannose-6-phosphate isomerase-like protein (cupin superfamily) [Litorimonas taeanensis]